MKRIINSLESKKMYFNSEDEKLLAERYLTYNTSWSMLKRSCNIIKFNKEIDGYIAIVFEDIKIAAMTNYYFSQMLKPLVENFEHNLKVYMSHQIMILDENDKQDYIKELYIFIDRHHDPNINKILKNDEVLFKLHDKLMLSDLIYINNLMRKYNEDIIKIDKKVKEIRNKLYHHSNFLYKLTSSTNAVQRDLDISPIAAYFGVNFNKKQLKQLAWNYHKNEIVQIIKMLYYTTFFLSQDPVCKRRKDDMFVHLIENLEKSADKYSTLEDCKKEKWVEVNFSILRTIFLSINVE